MIKPLKRIILSFSVLLILLMLSGCAYFNMFFNGRKHFNKGEEIYRTEEKVNRTDYESSLQELSKVLEFYPDNSLVPDVLLMMGKCYFRLGDNLKAKRKYQELIANYQESDLVQEAKLRLVEVAISDKEFDAAKTMISEIKLDKVDLEPFELKRLLGELELAKNDTIKAFQLFAEASDLTDNKKWQKLYLKKAAELAEKNHKFHHASNYYTKLSEISEDRKSRYDNSLLYGEMLEKAGAADSAFAVYKSLLDNIEYENYSYSAQLRVGRWYFMQKKYAESYQKLADILKLMEKKSENSAIMGEAAFWLGEYHLIYKQDFISAEKMYDSVRTFSAPQDLDYIKQTAKRSNTLKDYHLQTKFCSGYQVINDSLDRYIDTLNQKMITFISKKDTAKVKTTKQELSNRQKSLSKLNLEYVKNKYLLGEIFQNELYMPDSAIFHFSTIINRKDQPYYASRALFALAKLEKDKNSGKSESLFDSLLKLYPATLPSNYARELKGIPKITIIEDSVAYFFNLASEAYLAGDSILTDTYYNLALKQNTDSPLQPIIRQAAAVLNEKYLVKPDIAKMHYTFLKNNYPYTKEGVLAANKLRSPDEEKLVTVTDNSKDTEKSDGKEMSDEDKWFLMDRRNK